MNGPLSKTATANQNQNNNNQNNKENSSINQIFPRPILKKSSDDIRLSETTRPTILKRKDSESSLASNTTSNTTTDPNVPTTTTATTTGIYLFFTMYCTYSKT